MSQIPTIRGINVYQVDILDLLDLYAAMVSRRDITKRCLNCGSDLPDRIKVLIPRWEKDLLQLNSEIQVIRQAVNFRCQLKEVN